MDHKKSETGVEQVGSGFRNKSPLDVLAAASAMPGVSPQEMREQLGEVGIDVPEKSRKEKKEIPPEATGVGQVETGYLAQSPLDVLAAASSMPGVSPQEMRERLGEVGIDVPEKPRKEKKSHQSGVDSIEDGFLAEPEMSPVEELGAIRYAAAPQEVEEDIEKVEQTYKKPDGRLTPSEALLARLRESGYTGDLESLKKLAEELN